MIDEAVRRAYLKIPSRATAERSWQEPTATEIAAMERRQNAQVLRAVPAEYRRIAQEQA